MTACDLRDRTNKHCNYFKFADDDDVTSTIRANAGPQIDSRTEEINDLRRRLSEMDNAVYEHDRRLQRVEKILKAMTYVYCSGSGSTQVSIVLGLFEHKYVGFSTVATNLRRSTRKRRICVYLEDYTDSSGMEDNDLMYWNRIDNSASQDDFSSHKRKKVLETRSLPRGEGLRPRRSKAVAREQLIIESDDEQDTSEEKVGQDETENGNDVEDNDADDGEGQDVDASQSPSYWSRVCLYNMARLAKEATTVRRLLEPLFHSFDAENHWSSEKGLACSILTYIQLLLEESGINSHLLLSILVKHLDHKNIVKQPIKQIRVVNFTTQLGQNAKLEASVAIIGAITELMKQLRKCMQCSAEASSPSDNSDKWNADLQSALEKCILQLANKVGDAGPILDMMAVALENIPSNAAFPDALFRQLLLAMAHPDHETRVGAHHVFYIVLMPSLICPWLVRNGGPAQALLGFSPIASQRIKNGTDLTALRLSSHQVSLLLSAIWVQATSTESTPANFEAMAHTYNITLLLARNKNSSHMALVRCFQLAFSLRSISLDQEGLQPSRRRSLFTMASCMLIFSARAGNLPELIPLIKSSLTDETVDPYLKLMEDIRLHAVSFDEAKGYGSQEDEVAALKSLSTIELGDKQLRETVLSHLMTKLAKLSEDELSGIRKQLLEGFSPDDAYPMGAPLFLETPRPPSPLAQMEAQAFDEVMPLDALTDDESFPEPNGSQSGRKTSLSINSLDILSVNQLLESVLETARQVASLPVSSTPIPYDQVKNQCESLVMGKQQKMSVLQSFKLQQDAKAIVLANEQENKMPNVSHPWILQADFKNTLVGVHLLTMELSEEDLKLINIEPVQRGGEKVLACSLEYGQQQSLRLPPSSPYDKFLKAAGC
ncbi:unnamed protein product [Camellia sinensis]